MKRRIAIIICAIMLNLVLAGNVFATDFSVSATSYHSGWAPNFGYRAFNVDTFYCGNQYEGSGYQYVDGHDFIVDVNSAYGYDVPRGSAGLSSLVLRNTGGTDVSTLTASSFSSGTYRDYWWDTSTTYLCKLHSYSWLQSYAGSYYVEVGTVYLNSLFTGMSATNYYNSSYF